MATENGRLPVSGGASFRSDLSDLAAKRLREPDVGSVGRPGGDALRLATSRGGGKLGDLALFGSDAPDLVAKGLGEPQFAIGPGRDA